MLCASCSGVPGENYEKLDRRVYLGWSVPSTERGASSPRWALTADTILDLTRFDPGLDFPPSERWYTDSLSDWSLKKTRLFAFFRLLTHMLNWNFFWSFFFPHHTQKQKGHIFLAVRPRTRRTVWCTSTDLEVNGLWLASLCPLTAEESSAGWTLLLHRFPRVRQVHLWRSRLLTSRRAFDVFQT